MNQILNTKLEKNINQILSTNLEKNINQILSGNIKEPYISYETYKKKNWFKFQFVFSIFVISIIIICTHLYFNSLKKKENISNDVLTNYNIYRLYHNEKETSSDGTSNGLFGIIEIPKINLYYPIFSHLTEELLKTAPCKFYGDTPNRNGNICIAGHNYDNSLFFSKISTLSLNDEIYLFDNNGVRYVYYIYDIYEVADSDLSPIFNYEKNNKILTLVTCNNFNSNRIILKANQKKLL